MSRVLGADGIGIYSYTSSIMTYFTMFACLGTLSYGAREISQHRDDKYAASKLFYEIELMTIVTSLIAMAIWTFIIIFSTDYRYYFLALLPLLLGTMFDISWYFTGYERIKSIVIRNTACKIAGIVLLFLLVKEKSDLTLYILLNSLITMVGSLSMWSYLPKMLVKVNFKTLNIQRHLRETLVYFIPTIATSIYTALDKTLIGLITHDNYANGYYEQATKVIKIVKTAVFVSLNSVMGARIAYLFAQEKFEEIHRRIARSINFILLLGYGAAFGILGIAGNFVPAFFGKGYEPVIGLLCLMTPLIIIVGVSNCLGSLYYTPSGQRAKSAKFIVVGAIVNLCLNLCLIPLWGATGAIIASIIAELTIVILYLKYCERYVTVGLLSKLSWKRVLSGAVMYLAVIQLSFSTAENRIVTLVLQFIAGASIYFLLLLLLRDSMILEFVDITKGVLKRRKNK